MIIKFFEINKVKLNQNKLLLFYGKNEGHKNETIKDLIKEKKNVFYYDEKEILENSNSFIENALSKSLFENEKIIIIKRASDKILKVIEEITLKNIEDLVIIINADILDKKSKLRTFFEKSKVFISIAFYPDNNQTLSKLAYNFLREKKILISPSDINLIVDKCNNDRENLKNELEKIGNYHRGKNKITSEVITKLINLNENHSISELVDNFLIKNKKKIRYILSENNFSGEDCIMITRTFLSKLKKILYLAKEYEINKNIELTISSAKPPIFWKDKEITKEQLYKWTPKNIKNLMYKINELELLIKKNVNNSIRLVTNFILEEISV